MVIYMFISFSMSKFDNFDQSYDTECQMHLFVPIYVIGSGLRLLDPTVVTNRQ